MPSSVVVISGKAVVSNFRRVDFDRVELLSMRHRQVQNTTPNGFFAFAPYIRHGAQPLFRLIYGCFSIIIFSGILPRDLMRTYELSRFDQATFVNAH